MRDLDLNSMIVAAVIGGIAGVVFNMIAGGSSPVSSTQAAMMGAAIGATVQIGVRVTGVS